MPLRPPFASPYSHGFVRVGAAVPAVAPADPAANGAAILDLVRRGHAEKAAVLVFPELCVTAYAIDDLHLQETLLEAAEAEIGKLCAASRDLDPLFVIGAPLRSQGLLYNCAVVIHRGRILGVTPKSYLPNYREFYEDRWFTSGAGVTGRTLGGGGSERSVRRRSVVPLGRNLPVRRPCGDLRGPVGPQSAVRVRGHGGGRRCC